MKITPPTNPLALLFLITLGMPLHLISAEPAPAPVPDSSQDFSQLRNPVWTTRDNLRDPSVYKAADGYHLYYSRYAADLNWGRASAWSVREVVTRDFVHFDKDHAVTPDGYASPGDVVFWGDRFVLPYQHYPSPPKQLYFSESRDHASWSAPQPFLAEALALPWNTEHRAIDPTFVIDGDTLHCFFVGSAQVPDPAGGKPIRANLLGHAITRDPALKDWTILTMDHPLIGTSERAPDGVENIAVFRTGTDWTMIYSEGLAHQHIALATSPDLMKWTPQGRIELPMQNWMQARYGAPFVWPDGKGWLMVLMGEDANKKTTFGLLSSSDGRKWNLLPERANAP